LKIANAVRKALNFKDNQLEQSVDVESFVGQLIGNRVRLEIPREGNEEVYAKAVFNKLVTSWWGRRFPNLMFWINIQRGLPALYVLSFLIIILAISSLLIKTKIFLVICSICISFWYSSFMTLRNREDFRFSSNFQMKRLKLFTREQKRIFKNKTSAISPSVKTLLLITDTDDNDFYEIAQKLSLSIQSAIMICTALTIFFMSVNVNGEVFKTVENENIPFAEVFIVLFGFAPPLMLFFHSALSSLFTFISDYLPMNLLPSRVVKIINSFLIRESSPFYLIFPAGAIIAISLKFISDMTECLYGTCDDGVSSLCFRFIILDSTHKCNFLENAL